MLEGQSDIHPSLSESSPNPHQAAAIRHKSGPCLVIAGPGSGKTYTITMRIRRLLDSGADPSQILVITFTRQAAAQMKRRLVSLVGNRGEHVPVGTFHRIFFGILRENFGIGAAHIMTDDEKELLLRQALRPYECGRGISAEQLIEFTQMIGCIKNEIITRRRLEKEKIGAIPVKPVYETYEKLRIRQKKIDYDDIILLCRRLLEEHPEVRLRWQRRFSYIMIDEFQDINRPQYETVCLLLSDQKNLFVVGDDDQAIYGFRGADVSLMLGFPKQFPGANQVSLTDNYRSVAPIVDKASEMVSENTRRFPKSLRAVSGSADADTAQSASAARTVRAGTSRPAFAVRVVETQDMFSQSKFVRQRIEAAREAGVALSDMAILYRIHAHGRLIVSYLSSCGIPFETSEQFSDIHDHFVFRDLFAYMSLAYNADECEIRRDLLQIMNRPKRYISREALTSASGSGQVFQALECLRRYYFDMDRMQDRIDNMERDLRAIRELPPQKAIGYIRKVIGYDDFLMEYAEENAMDADSLLDVAQTALMEAESFATFAQWQAWREQDRARKKEERTGGRRHGSHKQPCDALKIMSMHSSKGLEFHTVFILDVTEGSIPYKKAVSKEEIEEERRLFYVAMTRAKRQLYLIVPDKKNGKKQRSSRFLRRVQ